MPYKNPEDRKKKSREYYAAHKEERALYSKNYVIAHRDKIGEYYKKYCDKNREKIRGINLKCYYNHHEERKRVGRQYKIDIKKEVFEHYGSICACCGESILAFLSLDHIAGGGNKHRKEIGVSGGGNGMYQWIKTNNYPSGFQVLCHNCNMGKQINGGTCPHKETELK